MRAIRWGGSVVALVAGLIACGSDTPPLSGGGVQNPPSKVCAIGVAGCDCTSPGQVVDCGEVIRKDGDYATCSLGKATCSNGKWGACIGDRVGTASLHGLSLGPSGIQLKAATTSACVNNPCNPYCSVTSTIGSDVPDAAGLGLVVTEDGGLTLPSTTGLSNDGGVTACNGLQCAIAACGGNKDLTTITGTVYDPAGKVPLYNAYVYIPVDPNLANLPAFPDSYNTGITCDTCSGATLNAVAVTSTDAAGNFTLKGVPNGTSVPLVVQMGKWRRSIVLETVTACTSNAVTNNCTATDKSLCKARLPGNRFDGYNPATGGYSGSAAPAGKADLPRVAMVSGNADPFECMLLKAGIDPNEFGSTTKNTDRKFHFYRSPFPGGGGFGGGGSYGASIEASYADNIWGDTLWNSVANLKKYDLVILACEGDSADKQTTGMTPYQNLIDYTNAGGRVFTTHWGYVWIDYGFSKYGLTDWKDVATWLSPNDADTSNSTMDATVLTNFPKGAAFSTWLTNVSATTSANHINIEDPRQNLTAIGANTTAWMSAVMPNPDYPAGFNPHFTYNTPYTAAAANQCGRVVFSDFHVGADAQSGTSTCMTDSDCGYGTTCIGANPLGTCSEPCRTNADCKDATYSCVGATVGSCTAKTCNNFCGNNSGTCVSGSCKCTTGSHCASGSTCSATKACDVATCASDSDCGSTETCVGYVAGACKGKSCNNNNNCANNNAVPCSASTCSCNDNGDCGNGRTCTVLTGKCTAKSCGSNSDCRKWERCSNVTMGTCQPKNCANANDCGGSNNGSCVAGKCQCSRDSACGSGSCSTTPGTCSASTCYTSSNCGSSQTCSGGTYGSCQKACTTDANCTGGEKCVSGSCTGCFSSNQCTSALGAQCTGATSGTCKYASGTTRSSSVFPGECIIKDLSPQEKALEFMFFDLTACITPDSVTPVTPQVVTTFSPATFTQDYVATCDKSSTPRWREVQWRGVMPAGAGASIVFRGQTGTTAASLLPATPVTIATSTTTSPAAPAFDVAYIDTGASGAFNLANPVVVSQQILRLTINLNPTTDKKEAPTLNAWNVIYDCVPNL